MAQNVQNIDDWTTGFFSFCSWYLNHNGPKIRFGLAVRDRIGPGPDWNLIFGSEVSPWFKEAEDLIDKFWDFQSKIHEILIPRPDCFTTTIPEVYHYKEWLVRCGKAKF